MTTKKRITFYAASDLVDALRDRAERTGAPIGELVRRAIRMSFFADRQSAAESATFSKRAKASAVEATNGGE